MQMVGAFKPTGVLTRRGQRTRLQKTYVNASAVCRHFVRAGLTGTSKVDVQGCRLTMEVREEGIPPDSMLRVASHLLSIEIIITQDV